MSDGSGGAGSSPQAAPLGGGPSTASGYCNYVAIQLNWVALMRSFLVCLFWGFSRLGCVMRFIGSDYVGRVPTERKLARVPTPRVFRREPKSLLQANITIDHRSQITEEKEKAGKRAVRAGRAQVGRQAGSTFQHQMSHLSPAALCGQGGAVCQRTRESMPGYPTSSPPH